MSARAEGEPVTIKMANGYKNLVFARAPELCQQFDGQVCERCTLHNDPACARQDCDGGLYLTEERYALAKLLGVENLDPE